MVRLPSTLYPIFVLSVALRQLPTDSISPAGHIKRALKKHRVTDFEFVDEHCWLAWCRFGLPVSRHLLQEYSSEQDGGRLAKLPYLAAEWCSYSQKAIII
jgi:membrane-bound lytic murein transglycosylase MltF